MSTPRVTAEQVNSYVQDQKNRLLESSRPWVHAIPSVVCNDGFRLSVQASSGHYCSPRSDTGPWDSFEVGFPSIVEPLLFDYADEPGNWTDTVYGQVPSELVAAVIELHGGFNESPGD